jgi:hypothetical protein
MLHFVTIAGQDSVPISKTFMETRFELAGTHPNLNVAQIKIGSQIHQVK